MKIYLNDDIIEYFTHFFNRPLKITDCWEWTGPKNDHGYGTFRGFGLTSGAHRISYRLFIGPIPVGSNCCHECDNSGCVNPAHLYLATDQKNMQHAANKMRQGGKGPQRRRSSYLREVAFNLQSRMLRGERI